MPPASFSDFPFPDFSAAIELPARKGKPGLGTIYVVPNHPQIPPACRGEQAFVILWDLAPANLHAIHMQAAKERVPHWSASIEDFGAFLFPVSVVYRGHCIFPIPWLNARGSGPSIWSHARSCMVITCSL